MPKRRLGVVLLVPPPVDAEVDGLRRALGDPSLGRVPAHLTLVPPVNVRDDKLAGALDLVRTAAGAAGARPLTLTLGPAASFLPANPVVYLEVGGDLDELHALRDRVFTGPLERPLSWPFVPHVTLADGIEPERVSAGVVALSSYARVVAVDRVHVLEERPGPEREWLPLADYPLAAPSVVGRGGLPVELMVSDRPDPQSPTGFSVTARRDGVVIGLANVVVEVDAEAAVLFGLYVVPSVRGEGVARHLVAAARSEAARRGLDLTT